MIEAIIQRILRRLYPELASGLHLPLWGIIASDPRAYGAGISDDVDTYVVDVQITDPQGQPTGQPVLDAVPLPVTAIGDARGIFGFPHAGAIVELGFVRGLPHKPFIRSVHHEGKSLVALEPNELLIQNNNRVWQKADKNGNWYRETNTDIKEKCENYDEAISGIKNSLAAVKQNIQSDKIWLGNDSDNVLQLLSDLMDVVKQLGGDLASHAHVGVKTGGGMSGPSNKASNFSQASSNAGELKGKLDPII